MDQNGVIHAIKLNLLCRRGSVPAWHLGVSRSSSGYVLGAAMLLILPWSQSLNPTRDYAH